MCIPNKDYTFHFSKKGSYTQPVPCSYLVEKEQLEKWSMDLFPIDRHFIISYQVSVKLHLQRTLEEANYMDSFQSEFRTLYNIKTELIALLDYLWQNWDGAHISILALLVL